MSIGIGPETFELTGLDPSYTAAGFAALEFPACPVCGAMITVDRVDVTLNAADEAANGRSFVAGLHECPRGCDWRTGERKHFSVTWGQRTDGGFVDCSCGVSVAGLDGGELTAALLAHGVLVPQVAAVPDASGALAPVTIPPEAITAAAAIFDQAATPTSARGDLAQWSNRLALAALEAAAPHIVNAEQARAQDGAEEDQDRIILLENALHAVDPRHPLLNTDGDLA